MDPYGAPGAVLLVSCYELGRQPFNIASPWAQLEAAGFGVGGIDTALDDLATAAVEDARVCAISVPMHTALRLGLEVARAVRRRAPHAHICFFGLYAALNARHLLDSAADSVIGGEFEQALVDLCETLRRNGGSLPREARAEDVVTLRKLPFVVPRRDRLAPLERYAAFFGPRPDETRMVAYVEASRGCRHTCLHCPVTAVYQGRFFVVPKEVVLADAAQQIAAGARHVTFGDPDFFNGPGHSMAIARALHQAHPDVSFDVTIKVEHLLRHRAHLAELADLGCAFVVTAIEALSDRVLAELDKGHTRAHVFEALSLSRAAGLPLRPSFVAFTPWTSLDDYLELVDWVLAEGLADHLEPIQLAIRLLVPPGSAFLRHGSPSWLGALVEADLGYRWDHPDPRMDALCGDVSAIVEAGVDADAVEVVRRIRAAAYARAAREPAPITEPARRFVPRLSESWFCCAEPSPKQMAALRGGSCDQ
jgi:radical SAM family protein